MSTASLFRNSSDWLACASPTSNGLKGVGVPAAGWEDLEEQVERGVRGEEKADEHEAVLPGEDMLLRGELCRRVDGDFTEKLVHLICRIWPHPARKSSALPSLAVKCQGKYTAYSVSQSHRES